MTIDSAAALPTEALSLLLREETRDEHRRAESVPFVEHLLAGRLDVTAYADLAAQQHWVYEALEEAGSRHREVGSRAAALVLDELERRQSIALDLSHLYGPGWQRTIRATTATRRYARHLRRAAATVPGYAAHAYTRYLGDVSGGQVIRTMLTRHYGVGADALNFYTFGRIASLKRFKDAYRALLDDLDLTPRETQVAVREARLAFELNRQMLLELGERHEPAVAAGPPD